MTQAYSKDFCAGAFAHSYRGETIRPITTALQISFSCVSKWRKLQWETRNLKLAKMNGHQKRTLSRPHSE